MKFSSLILAGLAATGNAAVFDETEADYTVVVPAGAYHCYFQPMEKGNFWTVHWMALPIILGTAFEIEYQVLEGGDLDIDFQMSSPSGTLLFNELRSEEGLHEIPCAEEGDYKVGYFQFKTLTFLTLIF